MLAVADSHAQRLQQRFVLGVHFDVGEHGEIVAGAEARQMGAQVVLKRAIGADGLGEIGGIFVVGEELEARLFEDRLFRREASLCFRTRRSACLVSILLASTSG